MKCQLFPQTPVCQNPSGKIQPESNKINIRQIFIKIGQNIIKKRWIIIYQLWQEPVVQGIPEHGIWASQFCQRALPSPPHPVGWLWSTGALQVFMQYNSPVLSSTKISYNPSSTTLVLCKLTLSQTEKNCRKKISGLWNFMLSSKMLTFIKNCYENIKFRWL